jgi:hypothetical protein
MVQNANEVHSGPNAGGAETNQISDRTAGETAAIGAAQIRLLRKLAQATADSLRAGSCLDREPLHKN